jgi:hypothetical protein
VGDSNEIVLYDISDPGSPVALDRETVRATARDLVFDGEFIGAAMGGHGAAVLRVVDDQLVLKGEFDLPGSTYGMAIDGERLWTASWSDIGLIWLGAGGPVVIGTEPVDFFATGVGAAGGRVVVADWFATQSYEHVEGVAGPELVLPDQVFAIGEDVPKATILLANLGAMTLEATASTSEPGISLSATEFVLEPGQKTQFSVTGEAGRDLMTNVLVTSNDPDEPTVSVIVRTGEQSIGQPHEDFTVEGYVYPDSNLSPYTLSAQRGRVTFLAYFALY